MSQKKIIIWSLMVGFVINMILTYSVYEKIPCAPPDLQLDRNMGFRDNPGYGGCRMGSFYGWPLKIDGIGPYEYENKIVDQYHALKNSPQSLIYSDFKFWINFIFWSFVICLVLVGIKKLKKKQETVQPNFDQHPKI